MSKRYKRVVLLVLMLAMILALAGSSLAEDATATPTPTETAEADAQETPSPEPTAESEAKETEEAPETPEAEAGEKAGETLVTPSLFLEEGQGVELTVYNQNLGLVKEVRTFDLEAGSNEVRYADVAAEIDPTSVHFVSLTDPEGTVVLEQNYEYDVVSSRKLLQKYVDKEIALRTKDGAVYTGTLLSGKCRIASRSSNWRRYKNFPFPRCPRG